MIKLHNKRGMAVQKATQSNAKGSKVGSNIIQKVKKSRYGGGIK